MVLWKWVGWPLVLVGAISFQMGFSALSTVLLTCCCLCDEVVAGHSIAPDMHVMLLLL